MLIIQHRVNDLECLRNTPRYLGVEVDIHAYGGRLVAHHDAFVDAVDFDKWLDAYAHRFLVLNVKEEGIEQRVRELTLAHGIEDFFLLDMSFPALVKMARRNERRMAVRVSEYEPAAGALSLAGLADWVWLDVFKGFPIRRDGYDALRRAGFKLCLVSPELHGRDAGEIAGMRRFMAENGFDVDAVCTRFPTAWQDRIP